MRIRQLLRRLSYGELSNLAVSRDGSGLVDPAHHGRIVTYANEVMLRLHTRFELVLKDVILEQIPGRTHYKLDRRHAEFGSNGRPSDHVYIRDLKCEPFTGDVARIKAVYSRCGKLPLNDQARCDSLFTPEFDVIQVPNPRAGEPIGVTYLAYPKPLCEPGEDEGAFLDQVVRLPPVLHKALTRGIAAEWFADMGTEDGDRKSDKLLLKAEGICKEVEDLDLLGLSTSTSNMTFELRGFV